VGQAPNVNAFFDFLRFLHSQPTPARRFFCPLLFYGKNQRVFSEKCGDDEKKAPFRVSLCYSLYL
jgi:hypothetical protein